MFGMRNKARAANVIPGFSITMGYTLVYLSLIVLVPLSALLLKAGMAPRETWWMVLTSPRMLASYRLTFGASLIAAMINAVMGFIVAWTLVRYRFPGKKILDAMVDLPFALPTAVSGLALTALYAKTGWIGKWLEPFHIKVAFTPLGIVIALTFIGLPFVVRTLQPALEDLEQEVEDAAAILGASRWQTFWRILLPSVFPALMTGFALSFARALGEYGSVVFIAGNMPLKTEITSLLIMHQLEQYNVPGAAAVAVVMLAASLSILLLINTLQWWVGRRLGRSL